MASPQKKYREAWTAIWGGALSSIAPGAPFYPTVQAWWAKELEARGGIAKVLEIGAGAGAHPARIAVNLFPGALVVASDFRTAGPAKIAGVSYVCGAAIEALPFADGEFDLILFQFAFEYAQPGPATAELSRLLRPGGAALLLMHHPDALFTTYLRHRIDCLLVGLEIGRAAGAKGGDRALAKIRLKAALKRAETMAARYARSTEYPKVAADLAEFIEIGRRRLSGINGPDPEGDLAVLAQCEPALLIAQAQKAATNAPQEMAALMQRCVQQGFDQADYASLLARDGRGVVAWALRLQKRA